MNYDLQIQRPQVTPLFQCILILSKNLSSSFPREIRVCLLAYNPYCQVFTFIDLSRPMKVLYRKSNKSTSHIYQEIKNKGDFDSFNTSLRNFLFKCFL